MYLFMGESEESGFLKSFGVGWEGFDMDSERQLGKDQRGMREVLTMEKRRDNGKKRS